MTIRPAARLTDARGPVAAYQATYISLISEAKDDQGLRLNYYSAPYSGALSRALSVTMGGSC